uniref:Late genes activator p4 n=1 Tax=Bacillus phage PZA TaxID=10757 RepID=TF4_BPPZA|nr:late transcriptional activator [Bacillus phage PZA]P06952.1 RecName: Full=Late genes activator p4; AltName: Full=Gene product 4; Short=gp4; AltName: Full=Protein p4 [Bacillus phage PZA]AAA88476.1 gene 4 product [Bacillus phage PZA]prf//1112171G ORF 4 [Bacillus phage PZA]
MPKTQRGIYHNLKESKYVASNNDVTFFFSSELYLNKFLDGYQEYRKKFNKKIERVAVTPWNMDMLADITFYSEVEKRGFHAWLKGDNATWREVHVYALRIMTKPSTLDWSRIQKPKLRERRKSMV